MDDEPWKVPDDLDLDWRVPSSLREVRERWHSDALVRLLVGVLIALFVASFLAVVFAVYRGLPA